MDKIDFSRGVVAVGGANNVRGRERHVEIRARFHP